MKNKFSNIAVIAMLALTVFNVPVAQGAEVHRVAHEIPAVEYHQSGGGIVVGSVPTK